MKMLKRITVFLSYDVKTMLILIETYLYLGLAKFLILIPFSKVAPSLGLYNQETSDFDNIERKIEIKKVSQSINLMSKHTIWKSQCLVKAIAGMKMLERRKIESTLYLGTRKDMNGKLIAHAWLRSGTFYVSGKEGMEQFVVVSKFAKRIKINNIGEFYGKQL